MEGEKGPLAQPELQYRTASLTLCGSSGPRFQKRHSRAAIPSCVVLAINW